MTNQPDGAVTRDPLRELLDQMRVIDTRLKSVEQLLRRSRKSAERWRGGFDGTFQSVADVVLKHGRTLLGRDRLYVLWQSIRNASHMGLPAAEVGTYRGGSAHFIAAAYVTLTGSEVPLHVFDTFEGHPAAMISEFDTYHKAGMFSDIDYEEVKAYLSGFAQVQIHRGEFSETAKTLPDLSFGFAHFDVDLYRTTLDCLEYFGGRVAAGGSIVIDDYGAKKCPGVAKAVASYLDGASGFQTWQMPTQQLLLVKI